MCFHWKSLRRQVRVRGPVEVVTTAEADAYFASRPRGSRIGAWASQQSRPLESRFALEKAVAEYTAKHLVGDIPRPDYWSGFRIAAADIEFWHDRPFRLHDRTVFSARRRQLEEDAACFLEPGHWRTFWPHSCVQVPFRLELPDFRHRGRAKGTDHEKAVSTTLRGSYGNDGRCDRRPLRPPRPLQSSPLVRRRSADDRRAIRSSIAVAGFYRHGGNALLQRPSRLPELSAAAIVVTMISGSRPVRSLRARSSVAPLAAPAPRYYAPRRVYRPAAAARMCEWCYNRYRSYDAYDNTFQPYGGPRRQCYSPYS